MINDLVSYFKSVSELHYLFTKAEVEQMAINSLALIKPELKVASLMERTPVSSVASIKDFQELESHLLKVKKLIKSPHLDKLQAKVSRIVKKRAVTSFSDPLEKKAFVSKLISKLFKRVFRFVHRRVFLGWDTNRDSLSIITRHRNIHQKLEKLEKELSLLEEKRELLGPSYAKMLQKLTDEKTKTKKAADHLNSLYQIVHEREVYAEKVKQEFALLGGERVSMTTSDCAKLDGIYLSAQEFRTHCKNAGVKSFQISDRSPLKGLQGLIADLNGKDPKEFERWLKSLTHLHAFPHVEDARGETKWRKGAGWAVVEIPSEKKYLIISEEQGKEYKRLGLIEQNPENTTRYVLPHSHEMEVKELDQVHQPGTVILTWGANFSYTRYKKEALGFLIRGMNVMLFDYRGYGKSQGEPTEKGTYTDLETVYHYLQANHPITDDRLVVKGLCMSGGIVAEFAAKHPKVNVILDQTYAVFGHIIEHMASKKIKKVLRMNSVFLLPLKRSLYVLFFATIKPLLGLFTVLAPRYNVRNHLSESKGNILLVQSSEEDFIQKNDLYEIVEKIPQQHLKKVQIAVIPGTHGVSWIDAYEYFNAAGEPVDDYDPKKAVSFSGRSAIKSFLNRIHMWNPVISA